MPHVRAEKQCKGRTPASTPPCKDMKNICSRNESLCKVVCEHSRERRRRRPFLQPCLLQVASVGRHEIHAVGLDLQLRNSGRRRLRFASGPATPSLASESARPLVSTGDVAHSVKLWRASSTSTTQHADGRVVQLPLRRRVDRPVDRLHDAMNAPLTRRCSLNDRKNGASWWMADTRGTPVREPCCQHRSPPRLLNLRRSARSPHSGCRGRAAMWIWQTSKSLASTWPSEMQRRGLQ